MPKVVHGLETASRPAFFSSLLEAKGQVRLGKEDTWPRSFLASTTIDPKIKSPDLDPMTSFVFFVPGDSELAHELAAALTARGVAAHPVNVTEIANAIPFEGVAAGLVVLSAASFDSADMARWVGAADHAGLDLYTVRVDAAPLTSNLGFFLKWSQWLDIEPGMGGEDLDFLARTIQGGKALNPAQRPSRLRARRTRWTQALAVVAALAVLAGGALMWNGARVARLAEAQADARAAKLLQPPGELVVGYDLQGSNPYIAERRLTLYFHAFALASPAMRAAVYRPAQAQGFDWQKVAQHAGRVRDPGQAGFHMLNQPDGDRLCLIYAREIGPNLQRAQYALYDLHAADDGIRVDLVEAGRVADQDSGCDALMDGAIDDAPLVAVARHERLLAVYGTTGYSLPRALESNAEGGLRVIIRSRGGGAGADPIPGSRISVFGRMATEDSEWRPHAHLAASRGIDDLQNFAPPLILICVQTPLAQPSDHIITYLIAGKSDAGSYETIEEGGPELVSADVPCGRFNPTGRPFFIDAYSRPDPVAMMLPDGTALRAGDIVQIGGIYPGQDWQEAVEAAGILLGGTVSDVSAKGIARLSRSRRNQPLPVIVQDVAPGSIRWLRAGDGTARFVILIRTDASVETVAYVYTPLQTEWGVRHRTLDVQAWGDRIKATFGKGIDLFGYGTGKSVDSAGLWLWPAEPASCDRYGSPRPKPGEMLRSDLGHCITQAGAKYDQRGSQVQYTIWSTSRQRLPW
ncbi:hypothetical protein [Roseivivax sp. CAU 1753]